MTARPSPPAPRTGGVLDALAGVADVAEGPAESGALSVALDSTLGGAAGAAGCATDHVGTSDWRFRMRPRAPAGAGAFGGAATGEAGRAAPGR